MYQKRSEADLEYARKRKEAKKKEKEILSMDLPEAAQRKQEEEQKNG